MEHSDTARARVVIIGGGIVGCAAAYHLARRGWTDVAVLERKKLTSGTTWHAAGLITQARGTEGTRRLVREGLAVFRDLEEQTGIGFQETGTIHVATTEPRWQELLRQADAANVDGIETLKLKPDELIGHHSLLDPSGLIGGVLWPKDGRGNASDTTFALMRAARSAGVTFHEQTSVERVLIKDGVVRGVSTLGGSLEAEYVINATGMWANQFARAHNVALPLQALEHYYIVTDDVPDLGRGLPTIKSSDDCAYVKDEGGRLLVGFFETGGRPWQSRGIPEDVEFATSDGEWDHIMPFFEQISKRVPVLGDVGLRLFFCGPESFTPDGNFHLGPVAGVQNYYAAVGFNSVGFLSGPGAGKYLAETIIEGAPPYALVESDPRRVQPYQTTRRYLEERVVETLDVSYGIHWPFEQRQSARGIRRSPVHHRLQEIGAVFGELAGWERANWFAREGVQPRYQYSFGRQNWFNCSEAEHLAVRQGVGLFDLSSFGKINVSGPGARSLLQRVCANDMDVLSGRTVYTQWLNEQGGIEADVTVTSTSDSDFLVLTSAGSVVRDVDWLNRAAGALEFTVIADVSNSMAMFAIMGPGSRDLLSSLTDSDLRSDAFPFGTSQMIDLGYVLVRATRLSYVGELGWELLVPVEMGAYVYEELARAGEAVGLVHAGYHALNSLRLEKGFRSWGHDIGPDDTPLEAGLGFAVAWDTDFIGRDSLCRQREEGVRRRLIQLLLEDPDAMAYHDEPVLRNGVMVGKVTSAAYGHSLGGTVALAFVADGGRIVTADWLASGKYVVVVAGVKVPARMSIRPFYDPGAMRMHKRSS